MRRFVLSGFACLAVVFMFHGADSAARPAGTVDSAAPLEGYSADSARVERDWEGKFRALPSPDNMRSYMQRISARPHHVGTEYDRLNAEWILSQFRDWGWDAHIENFEVLFPTPHERVVEL